MSEKEISLSKYKSEAKRIAKDFFYGKEVLAKIKSATTEIEITNILVSARHSA